MHEKSVKVKYYKDLLGWIVIMTIHKISLDKTTEGK